MENFHEFLKASVKQKKLRINLEKKLNNNNYINIIIQEFLLKTAVWAMTTILNSIYLKSWQ